MLSTEDKDRIMKEVDDEIYNEKNKKVVKISSKEEQLVTLAKEAYNTSTEYIRTYKLRDFIDAYRLYNNEHTKDSKYFKSERYIHSKFFIPKTQEFIKTQDAFVRQAFFANSSIIDFSVYNDFDKESLLQSDFFKTLFEYRISDDNNWFFKFILNTYHEGHINNFICSKNYYDHDLEKPVCTPISVERIRVHPHSDPFDIVGTSPYIINIIPMFGYQLKAKMNLENEDDKWNELEDSDFIKIAHSLENEVVSARNKFEMSSDESDGDTTLKDHQIIYVHENFIRGEDGEDYLFYTVGDKLLSKIYKTEDIYFQGRPFTIGHVMLEPGRVYPTSPIIHAKPLQEMINELQNISVDIKRKVAMPSYLVSEKINDLYALETARPGSYVRVKNTQTDIVPLQTPTQVNNLQGEINTAAVHFDDSIGRYGISTAQIGGGANSTVGGMQSQASSANLMAEYYLATYIETFVEPTLKMYLNIEKKYNSFNKGLIKKIFKDYGVATRNNIEEKDIPTKLDNNSPLKFNINIGVGASNPDVKFQRIIAAISQVMKFAESNNPNMKINLEEITKETFSILGYKNAERFFKKEEVSPEMQQLMQENQQLKQQLQSTKENNPEYIQAEIDAKKADAVNKMAEAKVKESNAEINKAQIGLIQNKMIESGVKAQFGATETATNLLINQESHQVADGILENAVNLSNKILNTSTGEINPLDIQSQGINTMGGEQFNIPQIDNNQVNNEVQNVNLEGKNNNPLTPKSPFTGINKGIETIGPDNT